MSTNDQLRDLYILRSILLEQLKTNYSNKLKRAYLDILNDMIKQLNSHDEVNLRNINKVIKELQQRINPNVTLLTDFQELAMEEATFITTAINTTVGMAIFDKVPKDSTLLKIANTNLFEGHTFSEVMKSFDEKIAYEIAGETRIAVMNGESIPQIRDRLNKIMNIKLNQAEAIARTSTATVVSMVRDEVYKSNEDIIKAYQWVATMDSRVRIEHSVKNGLTWSIDKQPIGHKYPYRNTPDGVNCRCILIPVLKSYRDLGFDIDEIPQGTRASMDGSVPAKLTFTEFLKSKDDKFIEKYLGKEKARLFLQDKITLSDLVTKNGKVLTLKELKELY